MPATRKKTSSSSAASFTGDERICVLHGKEDYLLTQYLRQLTQQIEKNLNVETDQLRFDGKKAEIIDVLDELHCVGLMMQYKIIVVDNADEFVKSYRKQLERYAMKPESTSTLVLRSETWNKGNLDKAITKVGCIIKCGQPSMAEARRWVILRSESKHGRKITQSAATALIDHLGPNLTRLDTELAKLAVMVGDGELIDLAQIEAMTGKTSDEAAWVIQDAILSGKVSDAIQTIHELVELANQHEVLVVYFVGDLIRKMNRAIGMLNAGISEYDICRELKIWPRERQAPFLRATRRLGTNGAAHFLSIITELDQRSKSGFGSPISQLERFCVSFAGKVG